MYELVVTLFVYAFELYLLAGVIFAIVFVRGLVDRIDPVVHGSTRGFRLIIIPGVVAMWPWLLLRVKRSTALPALVGEPHE